MWGLAVGGCAAGTSEFMPSGLLPGIADDLGVSIPVAGSVVSAFALGMIIGALGAALLAVRLPRKITLLFALLVLAAGHLFGSVASNFAALLTSRVVSAIAIGVFWTVATEFAVAISPETARARAIARLVSSMVVATVLGVPLGAFLGDRLGWRATFVAVALISVVAAGVLAAVVTELPRPEGEAQSLLIEARAFLNGKLLSTYLLICLYQSAVMGLMTFVKPLLLNVAGLSQGVIPWALALFGVGGFFGLQAGGRYADRWPRQVLVTAVALAVLAALILWRFAEQGGFIALLCMTIFGAAAFMAAPPLNARAFALSKDAPTLASGGNTAAFNVGNIIGPTVGGLTIMCNGDVGPALAAGVLGSIALIMSVFMPAEGPERTSATKVASHE